MKILIITAVVLLLMGCAGRAPQLTPAVQAMDQQSSCDMIVAEIKANNARITDLAGEQGWKVAQNVAAGVAGLVIPVLWFGMDFQNAAGKEAASLSQRNQYLSALAGRRCGAPVATASVPKRG